MSVNKPPASLQVKPFLRFKEFAGKWKRITIKDVSSKITDGTHDTPRPVKIGEPFLTAIHVKDGFIDFDNCYYLPEDIHDKIFARCNPEKGDLLVVNIGAGTATCALVKVDYEFSLKNVALIKPDKKKVVADFFAQIQRKNSSRLKHVISSGGAQPFLSLKALGKIKLTVPETLPEQQKIAAFLSAVDQKIQQLTRKKELLETYKKGLMQQLFSGALRFKDEEGKEYPDWEEKRLGDVAEDISYGMNSASTGFDGTNKYIRITDIDDGSRAFVPKPLTSPLGELDPNSLLKVGDILFARTGASVGKSYLYNENDGIVYFAGFLIRFSIKNDNPLYVFYQTLTSEFRKFVAIMSMRSGQPGINAQEYKTFKFWRPSRKEQDRISEAISSIDFKVSSISTQITKTQTFKKGLLQQMFV